MGITDPPNIRPSPLLAGSFPSDRSRRRLPQPVERSRHLLRYDNTARDENMRHAIDRNRNRPVFAHVAPHLDPCAGQPPDDDEPLRKPIGVTHDRSRNVSCAGLSWPRQEWPSTGEPFPLATEPNRWTQKSRGGTGHHARPIDCYLALTPTSLGDEAAPPTGHLLQRGVAHQTQADR